MNCKNCGKELKENETICPNCNTDNKVVNTNDESRIITNLKELEEPKTQIQDPYDYDYEKVVKYEPKEKKKRIDFTKIFDRNNHALYTVFIIIGILLLIGVTMFLTFKIISVREENKQNDLKKQEVKTEKKEEVTTKTDKVFSISGYNFTAPLTYNYKEKDSYHYISNSKIQFSLMYISPYDLNTLKEQKNQFKSQLVEDGYSINDGTIIEVNNVEYLLYTVSKGTETAIIYFTSFKKDYTIQGEIYKYTSNISETELFTAIQNVIESSKETTKLNSEDTSLKVFDPNIYFKQK